MPDHIDELDARVDALARQLCRIEARLVALEEHDARVFDAEHPPLRAAAAPGVLALESKPSEGALALTGRTLVALGGGYLIRAMTDAGLLPGMGVVGLGLAYSALWLGLAERSGALLKASASFHGIAGALIAYPLLWETTTRFGLLQPPQTLAILVFIYIAGMAVSAHRSLGSLAWVTTLLALGTTLALFVTTHHLLAGLVGLVAIAAAVELAAFHDRWPGLRWPAALALDVALLITAAIASDPAGLPRGYPPVAFGLAIAAALAVPVIYLASVAARTLLRGQPVAVFEIAQATAALVLGFGGAWKLSGSRDAVAAGLGAASLFLGALCYALGSRLEVRGARCETQDSNLEPRTSNLLFSGSNLEPRTSSLPSRSRNFCFYSITGGVLTLAGTGVILKGSGLALAWSLLALLFAFLGARFNRLSLRLHSGCYICAAIWIAGLLPSAWANLFGAAGPDWILPSAAGWIAAASAMACYATFFAWPMAHAGAWEQLSRGIPAWAVAWILAGILVAALAPALKAMTLNGPGGIATLRTAVLAFLILSLGWAVRRWKSRELAWLVYALLAAGGLKLLTEDLRHGHAVTLFFSLVLYGGALTIAPRLVRESEHERLGKRNRPCLNK